MSNEFIAAKNFYSIMIEIGKHPRSMARDQWESSVDQALQAVVGEYHAKGMELDSEKLKSALMNVQEWT